MRTNIFVIGVEVGIVESYGSRERVKGGGPGGSHSLPGVSKLYYTR